MSFTSEQVTELNAPLDKSIIKKRTKAGVSLSYVEGWHAIAEANRIFGFDGWSRETVTLFEASRGLHEARNGKQWRVSFVATVRVTAGGVHKDGTGFGSGFGKEDAIGDAIESAVKEAETDAMKRALMTYGNPFGLALYDKQQSQVASEEQISAYKARQDGKYPTIEADIRACQSEDELNACVDSHKHTITAYPDSWKDVLREEIKRKKIELRKAAENLVIEKGLGDPGKFLDDIEGRMNSAPDLSILDEILDEFNSTQSQFSFLLDEGVRIADAFDKNKMRLSEAA